MEKIGTKKYGTETEPTYGTHSRKIHHNRHNTRGTLQELIVFLTSLEFQSTENGENESVVLPLSKSGKEIWIQYYNIHNRDQKELGNCALAFHYAKLEAVCARIALIIHMTRCYEKDSSLEDYATIDATSVSTAAEIVGWFKKEAKRVYGFLLQDFSQSKKETERRKLRELIVENGNEITVRKLQRRRQSKYKSSDEAEKALRELEREGIGQFRVNSSSTNQRTVFVLHDGYNSDTFA